MTNSLQVARAVMARIKPAVSDWNALDTIDKISSVPGYACSEREPWGHLRRAMGSSSSACYHLTIGLFIACPVDEVATREQMAKLIDTETGAVMLALRDRMVEDELFRLAGRNIKPDTGRGLKRISRNQKWILPAYIDIDVATYR